MTDSALDRARAEVERCEARLAITLPGKGRLYWARKVCWAELELKRLEHDARRHWDKAMRGTA